MKGKYRFRHAKDRPIQVMFAHIPGSWFSTGTHDMPQAVLWAENKIKEDTGITRTKDLTLGEFAKGFYTDADPHGFKHRNLRRGAEYDEGYYIKRQSHLDNYILPKFGSYLMTSLTDVMIEDFFLDLINFRTKRDLADDTKNKVLTTFSEVLNEARRKGYIKANPCDTVKSIIARNKSRQHFTESELLRFFPTDRQELIRIWTTLQWAVFFLIERDTGFRPGEVAALGQMNFFPEFNGIFTDSGINVRTREIKHSIKTTKKGQKFKVGILKEETVILLQELIQQNPTEPYLFKQDGKFINSDSSNKHLRVCAKRANVDLDGRTQYSFRHSFQTYNIGRIPQEALLLLMGHTSNRKEYTHLDPRETLARLMDITGTKKT